MTNRDLRDYTLRMAELLGIDLDEGEISTVADQVERVAQLVDQLPRVDDDAIVATNALEMRFFLEQAGFRVEKVSCTDRYVASWLDWVLNLTPLKYVVLNSFLEARKVELQSHA